MEVPCCGGISYAAEKSRRPLRQKLPMQIITIGTDGGDFAADAGEICL